MKVSHGAGMTERSEETQWSQVQFQDTQYVLTSDTACVWSEIQPQVGLSPWGALGAGQQ